MNIQKADLGAAKNGSYYTVVGCGGDLQEWVTGIESALADAEIGNPTAWFQTTGAEVNAFAATFHGRIRCADKFQDDLTILMFPLDGLNVGRLAMFRLQMEDRWFDDIIGNMSREAA